MLLSDSDAEDEARSAYVARHQAVIEASIKKAVQQSRVAIEAHYSEVVNLLAEARPDDPAGLLHSELQIAAHGSPQRHRGPAWDSAGTPPAPNAPATGQTSSAPTE